MNPVPPYNDVMAVADHVPVVIVPTEFKLEAVVNEANDVTAVFTKVPVVGNVTFVSPVVVSVSELAPEVARVEPSAKVNVALVAGAVIVTLLTVVAVTAPFE